MAQVNGIVISIRAEHADEFERLFLAEELPIWQRLAAETGQLQYASLTRVRFGTEQAEGVVRYLIVADFRSMAGHSAHDDDPAFNAFLAKARLFQPEPPRVLGGDSVARYPDEPAPGGGGASG